MFRVNVPNFSFFFLVGILPWNFFAQTVLMATGSILDNGGLLRKVWLPREIFPVATVFFNLVQFLLALAVLLPLGLIMFHLPLSWSMLALFPILTMHVLFTLGLSFIVSTATVFFRDVRHFTEIVMMLLFWFTPIAYDVHTLPPSLRRMVNLNPLSVFVVGYQDALYRQVFPDKTTLSLLVLFAMLSLGVGYMIFAKYRARFAEEV
jgi:ABC-2 type transport system permease protein